MPTGSSVAPKDAEYPHVPTPKEHELSRQVIELRHDRHTVEAKLVAQIEDMEAQIHTLQVRLHDQAQQLQAYKRERMQSEQEAVLAERHVWQDQVATMKHQLDQEKNDKEAQKRWRDKFTITAAGATDPQLQQSSRPSSSDSDACNSAHAESSAPEPVDDVLAKFAQSIALLPARAAPRATRAGVLPFLVHLLRENFSDVVTGSVLMALVHLAIHEKPLRVSRCSPRATVGSETGCVEDEIVKAGAAAPLAVILESVQNPRVLVEGARLCAALSGFVPNKRVLASKNIVRYLIRLLLPQTSSLTETVTTNPVSDDDGGIQIDVAKLPLPRCADLQRFALSALVNLSHSSEILRSQIVNLEFIPTAVRYLRDGATIDVQAEAAKLLGNLAFNHVVNQNAIIMAEGDAFLVQCLTAQHLQQSPELVRASAIGVANLAYTSVNQLSIGYGEGMTLLLQLLVDATNPLVLEAAAAAISAICHQNALNKNRVAAQNGLQVLLYVISRSHRYGHDEDVLVSALECLAILVKPKAARQQVLELDGHMPVCQLLKTSHNKTILRASAMAVCALVPAPLERQLLLADSKESKLETDRIGLVALQRAKYLLYGSGRAERMDTIGKPFDSEAQPATTVPSWLSQAIAQLEHFSNAKTTIDDANLSTSCDEEPKEFHERSYYSLETLTEIQPDELCPGFYS